MAKFRTLIIAPSAAWAQVQLMGALVAGGAGTSYMMGKGVPLAASGDPATETHRGSHFTLDLDLSALASDVPGQVAAINASMDPEGTPITEVELSGFLSAVQIDSAPNEGESDSDHFDRLAGDAGLVRWQDPNAAA